MKEEILVIKTTTIMDKRENTSEIIRGKTPEETNPTRCKLYSKYATNTSFSDSKECQICLSKSFHNTSRYVQASKKQSPQYQKSFRRGFGLPNRNVPNALQKSRQSCYLKNLYSSRQFSLNKLKEISLKGLPLAGNARKITSTGLSSIASSSKQNSRKHSHSKTNSSNDFSTVFHPTRCPSRRNNTRASFPFTTSFPKVLLSNTTRRTFRKSTSRTFPLDRSSSKVLLLALCIVQMLSCTPGLCDDDIRFAELRIVPTPIPEQYFKEQPANTSVPEGDMAVMKCKTITAVNHCRWYYQQLNIDFYDENHEPKLVKDFKPSTDNDCSIRFTKVRKLQEGQWLCQARRFMSTTVYNTRPAILRVVTESEEREFDERNTSESSEENNRTFAAPTPVHPTATSKPLVPIPPRGPLPGSRNPSGNSRNPAENPVPQTPPLSGNPNRGTSIPPPTASRGPNRTFHGTNPREPNTNVRNPIGPRKPIPRIPSGEPRDPTAPTAIPAIGPPQNPLGPLPQPPVIPNHGGVPGNVGQQPHYNPEFERRPRPTSSSNADTNKRPRFSYSSDDHIQNTRTGGTATLPCKVDIRVSSCAWVMPNNALFVSSDEERASIGGSVSTLSINTPITDEASPGGTSSELRRRPYEFIGDVAQGNCTLRVNNVRHHDEGNWRCVVSIPRSTAGRRPTHRTFLPSEPPALMDVQGPLIHLHLMDYNHGVHLTDGTVVSTGTNITLIILFLVGLILFIVGTVIIYCCYKKVWSNPEGNSSKILENSPRNSEAEYTQQWFQGRNLKIVDPNYTDDFKMRKVGGGPDYMIRKIDAANNLKNAHVQYSDIDHYNQYISMSQGGPGSVRSSASSNTTLSTVAPDPLGRDRSISFAGASPNTTSPLNMHAAAIVANNPHIGPHHIVSPNGTIIPNSPEANMEGVSFYEIHRKLQRPVSLYSTGHVYEEIQEKIPFNPMGQQYVMNSQGILVMAPAGLLPHAQIATTPVYTNVVEDHDGYLIPNKSNKIVNTPTGDEDPSQYLPMTRELTELEKMQQFSQQNVPIHNMNNLSVHQIPTAHIQFFDALKQQQYDAATIQKMNETLSKRRLSNDSQLSQEQNNSRNSNDSQLSLDHNDPNENLMSGKPQMVASTPTKDGRDPNLNSTPPTKHQSHKTPSTTPNFRRQRMPLPDRPTSITSSSSSSQLNQPSKQIKSPTSQINLQLKPSPSPSKPQLNLQLVNSKNPKIASLENQSTIHQRTTSLPDTTVIGAGKQISHTKSPSLVPSAETYDVPRGIGEVPATVNGSEISLDDIDGTIV